jgi:cob(I)alamin adenosyltransferase
MRITKVYTRTGDKGTTGLADGSRVNKDDIRIESYGTVDELNSLIAICRQSLSALSQLEAELLDNWLFAIQNDLFNIGSDLATPLNLRWKNMILVSHEEVLVLEKMIDLCQESLTPLREFVLPGGTLLNAYFHLARTVCRRAERNIVTLSRETQINEFIIPYINRLSDLLFVLSRWVQHICEKPEVTWDKASGVKTIFSTSLKS